MLEVKRNRLVEGFKKEGLTDRQINNRLKKAEQKETEEKTQKEVKEMIIDITWKKSRTWGNCPTAEAQIFYKDGSHATIDGYKASGCGYDKESTVIANICNDTLKYLLWNHEQNRSNAPYGLRFDDLFSHNYSGGVGTSCYYKIMEFLGGKMENIASGKTFDTYKITF